MSVRFKHFSAAITIFCLVFGSAGLRPSAAQAFGGGAGIPSNPYQITNCTDLEAVNEDLAASYILTTDLECSEEFFPLAREMDGSNLATGFQGFTGTFDGDNYTIHFAINIPDGVDTQNYLGLFGRTSFATIKNLNLVGGWAQGPEGSDLISGGDYVGALAGLTVGSTVTNVSVSSSVTGRDNVGGLIGQQFGGTTTSGYAYVVTVDGRDNVGGLVGSLWDNGTISRSLSLAYATGRSNIGGLLGYIRNGYVRNSYASSTVTGDIDGYGSVGGLVGAAEVGEISNSYAVGTVVANSATAGFTNAGGLVGMVQGNPFTISNSFAAASVSAPAGFDGGFIGNVFGGTDPVLVNDYWDGPASGQAGCIQNEGGPREGCSNVDPGEDADYWKTFSHAPVNAWDFGIIWTTYSMGNFPWLRDYVEPYPFVSGDGSAGDPFVIDSCEALTGVNTSLGAHFVLSQSLDCTSSGNDVIIGSFVEPFRGDFDGNGHAITIALSIDTDRIALFSAVDGGTIYDLALAGTVSGDSYVGSLIGEADVGEFGGTTVYHVKSTVNITATGDDVGGLIGHSSQTTVHDSYTTGFVSSPTSNNIGGLIGASNQDYIQNTYSTGAITGFDVVGGLVGGMWGNSTFLNNFTASHVAVGDGSVHYGGIVAQTFSDVGEGTTGNIYDVVQSALGEGNCIGGIGDVPGVCEGRNMIWAPNPTYFLTDNRNPPLSTSWDFEDIWKGVADGYPELQVMNIFDGGNGSEEDPYLISTCEQLQAMNEDLTAFYELSGSVDCSMTNPEDGDFDMGGTWGDGSGFNPIGSGEGSFMGSFDGANYGISDVYINRPETGDVGIFADTYDATIQDIYLNGGTYTGLDDVGALIGHVRSTTTVSGISGEGAGTVTGGEEVGGLIGAIEVGEGDSSITDVNVYMNVYGTNYVGGLVGSAESTTFTDTNAHGDVVAIAAAHTSYIGGLIGFARTVTIDGASAYGDVTGVTGEDGYSEYIGGLIGFALDELTLSEGDAYGHTIGTRYVGGLVGYAVDTDGSGEGSLISIQTSSAHGQTDGIDGFGEGWVNANIIGGLIGGTSGGVSVFQTSASGFVSGVSETGGLIGEALDRTSIVQSYVSAEGSGVEGHNDVGGLVGYLENGYIEDSFTNVVVSGGARVGGLVGRLINTSEDPTYVHRSYAAGPVSGDFMTGGDIGYMDGGELQASFSTSMPTSVADMAAGLVGILDGGTITAAYYDADISGAHVCNNSDYSDGCIDVASGDIAYFFDTANVPFTIEGMSEWDADSVWFFSGVGLPVLRFDTSEFLNIGYEDASSVTKTSATLSARAVGFGEFTINDRGFEYGLSGDYGETISDEGESFSVGSYEVTLTGLTCGTTYYYTSFVDATWDGYMTGSLNAFETDPCRSSGGGGGSTVYSAPDNTYVPVSSSSDEPVIPSEPPVTPQTDTHPTPTFDPVSGRNEAPDSDRTGPSPYTGSIEPLSSVAAGWYIRGENYDTVYYVDAKLHRHPFWDTHTFFTYADSWKDVVWVTNATLATLPLDEPMLPKPRVTLVKIPDAPSVYATDLNETGNPTLRRLPSEAVALSLFGVDWADYVIDIPPTIFAHFLAGDELSSRDVWDKAKMKKRLQLQTEAATK